MEIGIAEVSCCQSVLEEPLIAVSYSDTTFKTDRITELQ
jgi:hypothetical protein